MFFSKKKSKEKENKIDKIVTSVIIGGAVAGLIGLSRTEKGKEVINNIKHNNSFFVKLKKFSGEVFSSSYELFGKTLAKAISIFNKKK